MRNSERLLGKGSYYMTSPFGNRIINGKKEFHNGIDYGTSGKKIPCYAIADGEVLRVAKDKFGGKFVYIRFNKLGKVGLYYHLDRFSAKQGDKVKKGDQVGIVGTTGQSTGIHLHFSLIKDNMYALNYYKADYENYDKFIFPKEEEEVVPVILIEEALKIFKEKGVANDIAYWMSATHIVPYLDVVILNSATRLQNSAITKVSKDITTISQAVKKLADNGILNDTDYWINAEEYIYNIKTLLVNIANKL